MGGPNNIEAYAPQLLLSQIGRLRDKPAQNFWDQYPKDLKDGYGPLCKGGSFNHQQILHAVRLWDASQPAEPAVDWWLGYLRQQLGLQTPDPGEETMGFFAGTEPFGPSYEPFRWASVLAVRLWTLSHQGHGDLAQLTARYAEVVCTLCALTAVPVTDEVRYWNERKNKMMYNGPFVTPVGERSNEHAVSDMSPLFALSVGWEGLQLLGPQDDWPLQVAAALQGDLGVSQPQADGLKSYVRGNPGPLEPLAAALTGIKVMTEEHVVRWPEGRLVWKPFRINFNTPCYLYDWFHYDQNTAELPYPWPQGRGFRATGAGTCWIDETADGRTIHIQTDYCGGDNPACPSQALPAGDPVSSLTIGPQGLVKDGAAAGPVVPPLTEPVPVAPGAPATPGAS